MRRRLTVLPLLALASAFLACGSSRTATSSSAPIASSAESTSRPEPARESAVLAIAPPASVQRARGAALAEFELGRTVVTESGCLACHRIGGQGHHEPGPNLTHVGSLLPRQIIERVLNRPESPMPSFSHLPRARFRALVGFLTLLQCPGRRHGLRPQGC